jgi:hypothetical protein
VFEREPNLSFIASSVDPEEMWRAAPLVLEKGVARRSAEWHFSSDVCSSVRTYEKGSTPLLGRSS